MSLRILFAGTPEIAVPSLQSIVLEHQVCGVLCAPDAPVGRGRVLSPCPVKSFALEQGLVLLQPERLDASIRQEISVLKPDLLVCVAYGKIFGPRFLGLFPKGGINMHPSLLPELRGPSPIATAILWGFEQSGISIQKLSLEMDEGDILLQETFSINIDSTCGQLTNQIGFSGAKLLSTAINGIITNSIMPKKQDNQKASYCHLIEKNHGIIDWSKKAIEIQRQVRAYNPWPRASTTFKSQPLYILDAQVPPLISSHAQPGTVLGIDKTLGILVQTGEGLLAIGSLQMPGKNPLSAQAFANGARDLCTSILGEQK